MSVLAINTSEFAELVDRAQNGALTGPGWGVYEVNCSRCGIMSVHVVKVGGKGFWCPYCDFTNPDKTWSDGLWDGAFLTPVGWQNATLNMN